MLLTLNKKKKKRNYDYMIKQCSPSSFQDKIKKDNLAVSANNDVHWSTV